MKTRLCFLNVQPHLLLVEQPEGFKTAEDFHKFAAQECGFTGITMPSGFLDLKKAAKSSIYRDEFQADLRKSGLTDGLVRLEAHVTGMNVCVAPFRVKRWAHFLDDKRFRTMTVAEAETMAAQGMREVIDASAAFGFKDIPNFCGGRGFPTAMAKWPAWPKYLALWVMALLAFKWNPILEYAYDRGQTITFEFGHPENDILTGENFKLFYSMLSPKARKAVGINADWSHFLNIGINPMPHMIAAASTGCRFTTHYKWGAVVDSGKGDASMYGGWKDWSEASTTFFTFAIIGPDSLARDFHRFNVERAEAQGDGILDVVYEGECVALKNPKQAMEIGAENCRAAISGNPFIKVAGIVDNSEDGFTITRPGDRLVGPEIQIIGKNGEVIRMAEWSGGPFDQAFDSQLKPCELLEMNEVETAACQKILEQAGFHEAASAVPPPANGPLKVHPKAETPRVLVPKPATEEEGPFDDEPVELPPAESATAAPGGESAPVSQDMGGPAQVDQPVADGLSDLPHGQIKTDDKTLSSELDQASVGAIADGQKLPAKTAAQPTAVGPIAPYAE